MNESKKFMKLYTQLQQIKHHMHELACKCGELDSMEAIFPLEEAYVKLEEVEQTLYDNEV